jgi:hypothetical protein
MPDVEVLGRNVSIARLPRDARDRTLPGRYGEIYHSMLDQALAEFPPIEGYETMHVMMMERAIYFFVKQKAQEDQPIQAFDLKSYRVNFLAFIKSCEGLLKEARAISAETAFKHNFVRQVVEVIDRVVADPELKKNLGKELSKIAVQY